MGFVASRVLPCSGTLRPNRDKNCDFWIGTVTKTGTGEVAGDSLKRVHNRTRKVKSNGKASKKSVRLTDNRLNQLETLGRQLIPALPNDVVGSIVARVAGQAEVLSRISEYRAAHPPVIPVPDAESLKEFLKNARKAYQNAHPGKRGPKFAEGKALVWLAQLEHELKRQPTRKEIIVRLTDGKNSPNTVSERTAEKIAKLYRQLTRYSWYGRTSPPLFKEDVRWLRKNLRPKHLTLNNWWARILEQWQHAKLDSIGLSKSVHDAFTLSTDDLVKERERLELLRLKHTFSKP